MKLSYKFAIVMILISVLSMSILGLLFSTYATAAIKARIYDQLQSVNTIKENQLNNYIERSMHEAIVLASDPLLIGYMEQFHGSNDSENNKNLTFIQEDFLKSNMTNASKFSKELSIWADLPGITGSDNMEEFLEDKISGHFDNELNYSEFDELSILTTSGVVDLSTDMNEKGKIKSNEKYFIHGMNSTYVQNFYISVSSREPTVTISTPIHNEEGKVLGVLIGNIHLDQISRIMTERSGLGNTGETIIVNKNHLLVSDSRFIDNIAFKKTIYSTGIAECLAGNDGFKEYLDYRNIDVIGFLSWIPEREVCLVTKIDKKEIYSALNSLYIELLLFGFILLLFSLVTAFFLSRRFTKPISTLVEGTEQWSKGNFNHTVPINSNDEIAILCKAFNDASQEMLRSRELEKNYTRDLKKELDKKTLDMKRNLEELEQSKKASLNIMDDLSETNTHLKDLDKAKTDFLNVASHELKTPLTAISAYLEILDDYKGQFNKEQLQGLDAIKRNSNQLKMLIGNILEVSRLDSGRFDLNITEINVREKINLLVDNLKILSDNKHIKLTYDCDGVEKIDTDAMRFEEILNNLIGNAIKFTDKGSITVKTEFGRGKEKGFVVISVIDTGVGIAEDKMSNLFQKFYQVDATVSRKYGGTGLGLSITKKMIELQGGKISVSSVIGKGTTFRFTLPIQPSKKLISNDSSKGYNKDDELYTNVGALTLEKNVIRADADKAVFIAKPVMSDKSKKALKKSKSIIRTNPNSKQINRHTRKKNN
jgi:signal transduction histidine kinase